MYVFIESVANSQPRCLYCSILNHTKLPVFKKVC